MIEICKYPECGRWAVRGSVFCRQHDKTGMGETDGSLTYRRANSKAHLYVVFGVITKRCKIGSSANVWERLREFQSGSADDLIVYCWARDCGKYERKLHETFFDFRLHGEWFSSEVTDCIARRVSYSKEPSEQFASLVRKQHSLRYWMRG